MKKSFITLGLILDLELQVVDKTAKATNHNKGQHATSCNKGQLTTTYNKSQPTRIIV